MIMKEMGNVNEAKGNATKDNVYTIHTNKYIEQHLNKPTTTIITKRHVCKYAHAQAVFIEFSRRQDHEPSTLRTFCSLKACVYKRPRQSRRR